jgi:hypothetical protein
MRKNKIGRRVADGKELYAVSESRPGQGEVNEVEVKPPFGNLVVRAGAVKMA